MRKRGNKNDATVSITHTQTQQLTHTHTVSVCLPLQLSHSLSVSSSCVSFCAVYWIFFVSLNLILTVYICISLPLAHTHYLSIYLAVSLFCTHLNIVLSWCSLWSRLIFSARFSLTNVKYILNKLTIMQYIYFFKTFACDSLEFSFIFSPFSLCLFYSIFQFIFKTILNASKKT